MEIPCSWREILEKSKAEPESNNTNPGESLSILDCPEMDMSRKFCDLYIRLRNSKHNSFAMGKFHFKFLSCFENNLLGELSFKDWSPTHSLCF